MNIKQQQRIAPSTLRVGRAVPVPELRAERRMAATPRTAQRITCTLRVELKEEA